MFKKNTALYVYKNKLELNKVDENAVKQGFFVFISPSQSANPFPNQSLNLSPSQNQLRLVTLKLRVNKMCCQILVNNHQLGQESLGEVFFLVASINVGRKKMEKLNNCI